MAGKYNVTIVRRDGLSPVERLNVKHYWWQNNGNTLNLAIGEHGGTGDNERSYEMWPVSQIDHIRAKEIEAHA